MLTFQQDSVSKYVRRFRHCLPVTIHAHVFQNVLPILTLIIQQEDVSFNAHWFQD